MAYGTEYFYPMGQFEFAAEADHGYFTLTICPIFFRWQDFEFLLWLNLKEKAINISHQFLAATIHQIYGYF